MSVRVNIAQGLKRTRKAAGKTVDEVGAVLGLSGKTISAWEVGRGQPDGDQLIALCEYLGANLSDFYGDEYTDLTDDESNMIYAFRGLNSQGKRQAYEYAVLLLQQHPKNHDDSTGVQSA